MLADEEGPGAGPGCAAGMPMLAGEEGQEPGQDVQHCRGN